MRHVSVSTAKARLCELLALVENGEEVLITKRGAGVARLMPVGPRDDDARIAELERRGVITRGTGRLPDDLWDRPRPRVQGNAAVEALLADREEGR